MNFINIKVHQDKKITVILVDEIKAALLNDYLKQKFIKVLDKKGNIEILTENRVVVYSILN